MNVALWIAQGLLCALFVVSGGLRIVAYEKYKAMIEKQRPEHGVGMSRAPMTLIASCEIVGAVGLIVPMATGIAPILTVWAAVGLALIMAFAIVFHLRRHEPPTGPVVLFVLSAFVGVGRFLQ